WVGRPRARCSPGCAGGRWKQSLAPSLAWARSHGQREGPAHVPRPALPVRCARQILARAAVLSIMARILATSLGSSAVMSVWARQYLGLSTRRRKLGLALGHVGARIALGVSRRPREARHPTTVALAGSGAQGSLVATMPARLVGGRGRRPVVAARAAGTRGHGGRRRLVAARAARPRRHRGRRVRGARARLRAPASRALPL